MTSPDVLVVGAGIAGASVAFALCRAGARVMVVDASVEGRATAAGAGIVQPWTSATTGPLYELYAAGAAHYPTVLEQLAEVGLADVGFRRCGGLVVHRERTVLDEVEARVRARRDDAPAMGEVTRVDETTVRSLFPPLAPGMEGLHVTGGARVDGRLMTAALLTATRRAGGELIDGRVELTRDRAGDGVTASVDGTRVRTGTVVVAGGAWTPAVAEPLGVDVAVEPQRGQIVHFHLPGVETGSWPSVSAVSDHYMLAFDDSRVVAGAKRETGSGFDPRVTAAGVRHVLHDALQLAPGLGTATVLETRVGLRPLPSDGLPTIGAVPGIEGLVLATGFGAIGLTIGPWVGSVVARLVVGERVAGLGTFAPRLP